MAAVPHTLEGEVEKGALWVGVTLVVVVASGAVVFVTAYTMVRLVFALRRVWPRPAGA